MANLIQNDIKYNIKRVPLNSKDDCEGCAFDTHIDGRACDFEGDCNLTIYHDDKTCEIYVLSLKETFKKL